MYGIITDVQKQVRDMNEDQQINLVVNYYDDKDNQLTTQVFTLPEEKWAGMSKEDAQAFVVAHGKLLVPDLVKHEEIVSRLDEKHAELSELVQERIAI